MRIAWGIAALVGVLTLAAVAFWPEGGDDQVAAEATPSATPTPAPSPTVLEGCDPAPTPEGSSQSWDKAPKMLLSEGTEYQLVLTTNCGPIVIDMLAEEAPKTVNSMLWLAEQEYFDSTVCHRLTTAGIFVLQCGDPTGTGGGGPGYGVPDENLPEDGDANYPAGVVAMAEASGGLPGSQFFIVYEDTTLSPDYTIWGTVTSGLDIVQRIAEAGVSGGGTDGAPAAQIGIEKARSKPDLG